MPPATIIIALGSNRSHGRHGRPADVVRAAITALGEAGFKAEAVSPILSTRAVGPGGRDYANAVMTSKSHLSPSEIMLGLKHIERGFGRRGGQKWGARVLDLDLIACGAAVMPSKLMWRAARGLAVPHPRMHLRDFVLQPMAAVAPGWRHPVLGLTTRQMLARLTKPKTEG